MLFTCGVLTLFVGILGHSELLLVSGVCIAGTGLVSLFSVEVGVRGPMGRILREVLGTRRIFRGRLLATLWLLLGIVVFALGAYELSSPDRSQPPSPDPAVAIAGPLG